MVIPDFRLKFSQHVRALAGITNSFDTTPERLVRATLHLWQTRSFRSLTPERAPWGTARLLEAPAVISFSSWLAHQPFNDAAYWLATAYAQWVGDEIRNQRALFFTPPRLAGRVITNLIGQGASLTDDHWHDPACGGAAFMVPIAQRMAVALQSAGIPALDQLKQIERNLTGNDLDSVLLDLSKSFLEMALYELIEASGYRPCFRLFEGDGLTSRRIELLRPDVIACNPPYRKLKAHEVLRYRGKHGNVIEGQPNVYGLFINRTMHLTRHGGLIGLLTPTSFLSGASFSKLRTTILTNSDTLQIDMLSDRNSMFIDVEQETAITILRKKPPQAFVSAHTDVSVLTPTGSFQNVGRYVLPNSGRPWPIPRAAQDAELLRCAEKAEFRIADYGYVARVGPLVAYRDTRHRSVVRGNFTTDFVEIPLVWATDITPDGNFDHGRENRQSRTSSFVRFSDLSDPAVLTKPVVLLQRLTASNQRSRIVAAAVPKSWVRKHGGFVCENHVIVLEPTRDDAVPTKLMAALLNTLPVNRIFRSICGASNVAISELNELPLPDPRLFSSCDGRQSNLAEVVTAAYQIHAPIHAPRVTQAAVGCGRAH